MAKSLIVDKPKLPSPKSVNYKFFRQHTVDKTNICSAPSYSDRYIDSIDRTNWKLFTSRFDFTYLLNKRLRNDIVRTSFRIRFRQSGIRTNSTRKLYIHDIRYCDTLCGPKNIRKSRKWPRLSLNMDRVWIFERGISRALFEVRNNILCFACVRGVIFGLLSIS